MPKFLRTWRPLHWAQFCLLFPFMLVVDLRIMSRVCRLITWRSWELYLASFLHIVTGKNMEVLYSTSNAVKHNNFDKHNKCISYIIIYLIIAVVLLLLTLFFLSTFFSPWVLIGFSVHCQQLLIVFYRCFVIPF